MTVVPLARVFVPLLEMPTVFVPVYLVPLTVTLQSFETVESILPLDVATSFNVQVMVLVLLATDWLDVDQLKTRLSQLVTVTVLLPLDAILTTYLQEH